MLRAGVYFTIQLKRTRVISYLLYTRTHKGFNISSSTTDVIIPKGLRGQILKLCFIQRVLYTQ